MVFGLFSKGGSLKRAQKKAMNRLAQSADRWAALQKLCDDGSDESLFTVCKRFSFTSLKLSDDEQEKAWVVQALSLKGEAALPALRRYMKSSSTVAYPLRVLESIPDKDRLLAVIDDLLSEEAPGYTNDTAKRISYIDWLGEWDAATDDEITSRVAPYVADFDEQVRFAAVEALSLRATEDAAEPLVTALLREEEESDRLKVRIAEVLADKELDLCGKKKKIAPLLDDVLSDFRTKRDKLIHKTKKKK
jgi:HEAT repeat protein